MSRLTEKKFLDNFKAIKNISPNYVASKEELMYEKLGKLEDLEEQLGCPLDVRCRIVTDSVIYDENGVEYKVVYTYMDYFDCENPFDNEMGYCDLCAFSWVDYKETWFLKKDKSE